VYIVTGESILETIYMCPFAMGSDDIYRGVRDELIRPIPVMRTSRKGKRVRYRKTVNVVGPVKLPLCLCVKMVQKQPQM